MIVNVIQYLRPDGRRRRQVVDLDDELKGAYKNMTVADCFFEAEELTTGEISITISDADRDVDIRIVENGPPVIAAMEEMLRKYQ